MELTAAGSKDYSLKSCTLPESLERNLLENIRKDNSHKLLAGLKSLILHLEALCCNNRKVKFLKLC